ncbi:MAG: hypothetical protein KME22_06670 [Hassallia sp. WJT32-NPBG1]|nr:hypothetical protein [Hassallia sp. WJT32-NPBG1]
MKTQTKEASRIEEIQSQIDILNSEITAHQGEIEEFEKVLSMIRQHPGWVPKTTSNIFELLESLIQNEPEEQQREKRLVQAQQALQESRQFLEQKTNTVAMLGQLLIAEKSEAEWQRRYAPFVEEYKSGFPPPIDPNVVRIAQAEKELADDRAALEKARVWLSLPETQRPRYSYSSSPINPKADVERLTDKIPQTVERLQKLKELPPIPRNEEDFRKYIIGRVAIEQQLQQLIQAQSEYMRSLAEFKLAAERQESAINFPLENLKELSEVVAIADNKIILKKGGSNG